MIKVELCVAGANARGAASKRAYRSLVECEAKAVEKAIEECKINCPVNGEVVLISDLKAYADNLRSNK